VQDHERYVHEARSMIKLGHLEPIAAEALTTFYASLICKELGLHRIILEGDVLQVVEKQIEIKIPKNKIFKQQAPKKIFNPFFNSFPKAVS
jgi:tRNA isopentenyl-2-thiomethyl-A-37 hydroxylase MiaE